MNVKEKIAESLRIESIFREPSEEEIAEYQRFVELTDIRIADLQQFVSIYQPGARLRQTTGMDVYIGGRSAPPGGPQIIYRLDSLLHEVNAGKITPFESHVRYELLHPFTDGNGRSGRMLWYWQMEALGYTTGIGFLHYFYYQSLEFESAKLIAARPNNEG